MIFSKVKRATSPSLLVKLVKLLGTIGTDAMSLASLIISRQRCHRSPSIQDASAQANGNELARTKESGWTQSFWKWCELLYVYDSFTVFSLRADSTVPEAAKSAPILSSSHPNAPGQQRKVCHFPFAIPFPPRRLTIASSPRATLRCNWRCGADKR